MSLYRPRDGSLRVERTSFLTPRETPVGAALMTYWRSSALPPPSSPSAGGFWCTSTTRRKVASLADATLSVGKRFCSIVAESASCCFALSKLERTSIGALCQIAWPGVYGRFSDDAMSPDSE